MFKLIDSIFRFFSELLMIRSSESNAVKEERDDVKVVKLNRREILEMYKTVKFYRKIQDKALGKKRKWFKRRRYLEPGETIESAYNSIKDKLTF